MNARLLMNVLYVWISAGHCRLYDPMLIQSAYRDSPLFFYGFNFFAEGGTQTFPFFSPEWWKSKGPAVCVVMPLSIRSELRCCWSIMKWSNTETITIESCIRKKINQNWIEKWQAKNKAALIQYVLLVSGPVWLSSLFRPLMMSYSTRVSWVVVVVVVVVGCVSYRVGVFFLNDDDRRTSSILILFPKQKNITRSF